VSVRVALTVPVAEAVFVPVNVCVGTALLVAVTEKVPVVVGVGQASQVSHPLLIENFPSIVFCWAHQSNGSHILSVRGFACERESSSRVGSQVPATSPCAALETFVLYRANLSAVPW